MALDIDTGSGRFCVTEFTLDDDASVVFETILPESIGLIWVSDISPSPDPAGRERRKCDGSVTIIPVKTN